jgi:hypothetical protein
MSKKPNAWMAHVMRTKAANPGMQLKDVLIKAGETYKKDASSSSSTKHKTHKKHGGLIALPLFGGRKRRGGEEPVEAGSGEAASDDALIQAGGGPLSPADVSGMNHSSGTALQLTATQYSGGKKSRRKSSRKSKSKSKSKKSSRSRRHHRK